MNIEEAVKACEDEKEVYNIFNLEITKVGIEALLHRKGEWLAKVYPSTEVSVPVCGLYSTEKDAKLRLAFLLRKSADDLEKDVK